MIRNVNLFALTLLSFNLSLAEVSDLTLNDIEIRGYENKAYVEENKISPNTPVISLLELDNDGFRRYIYGELWGKIYESNDLEEVLELTELFVRGIDDSRSYVLNRLVLPPFEKEYFSDKATQRILSNELPKRYRSLYIRVLGVAEITDPDVDTKALVSAPPSSGSNRIGSLLEGMENKARYDSSYWSALLVEARHGNLEALQIILDDLQGRDEGYLMGNTQVIEDLGFVRQQETVDLLVKYLFSELGSPSQPLQGGDDYGISPLACHAVKALSLSLIDFPYHYWDANLLWDDVEEAREFIRNYEGAWRIIGKWQPEEAVKAAPVVEVIETPIVAEVEESSAVVAVEPTEEPAEKSSNWWLWLIGAVTAAIVITVLRKKNPSAHELSE